MKLSTDSKVEGLISGLAAGYWLIYTILWTCTYMKAQQRKLPLSLMGKSFYLIALLYQLFAIAFFTADCVDRCVERTTNRQSLCCLYFYMKLHI